MRLYSVVIFTLVAAPLLWACGGLRSPSPTSTSTGAPAAGAAATATAQPSEDCGTEILPQGVMAINAAARDCMLRAYQAGRAAVFTSARPTTEGDPIVTHVEVRGSGYVQVVVDSTQDKFAGPSNRVVRTYRCTTLALISIAGQRPLSVTGCTDGAVFVI